MQARSGPAARARRLEKAFGVFGLSVTALFLSFLLYLLLFGGGEGHGSSASVMHEGASASNHTMGSGAGHGAMQRGAASGLGAPFGFIAIAASAAYLAAIAVWARLRRKPAFLVRHLASAGAMLVLVVLYLNARGGFEYNGHDWNRSFGDASVVLFAATLAIGPLARLWRPASQALEWRRETGIWATIAAAIHIGIFWEWSLGWGSWRRFFYPANGQVASALMEDRANGFVASAFQVANVVGLVALVYAIVLAVTSNDASQRWLRGGWSWIMKRATTMQVLILLHTWLFAYYLTREQALPAGTLWASLLAVLLLQTAAFAKTVWLRRPTANPPVA